MPVRKILKNYRNVTGLVSRTNGSMVAFESTLERDYYSLLDWNPHVSAYEEQPVTLEYTDSVGKDRRYTPDVLVHYLDPQRKPLLVEIKYHSDLRENWDELSEKLSAAHHFAKEKGWRFRIVTERSIRTPFLKNIKYLKRYRRSSGIDLEVKEILLKHLGDSLSMTPAGLLSFIRGGLIRRESALYTLWQLIASGEVQTDLSTPISQSSRIWIGERP